MSKALLLLAATLAATPDAPVRVGAAEVIRLTMENFDAHAPAGKEADALPGDWVIRNDHLVAVVANPVAGRDANASLRAVGGAIVDLTLRREPNDLLGVYRPAGNRFTWSEARIVRDAPDGRVSIALSSPAHGARPGADLTYSIGPDDRCLFVTIRVRNDGARPLRLDLADLVRAEGPSFIKGPDGEADLAWFHDPWFGQAYGVMRPDGALSVSHEGESTVLRDPGGVVPIAPGASHAIHRCLVPGRDLFEVAGHAARRRGARLREVAFRVTDPSGAPRAGAEITLLREGAVRGRGRTGADGRIATEVPLGEYEIRVGSPGRDDHVERGAVTASPGEDPLSFEVVLPALKQIRGRITDEAGAPVPCRVIVEGVEGTPTPDFGPIVGESRVRNVIYSADGSFLADLPAGVYEIIVSRGPEYDAIRRRVDLTRGTGEAAIEAALRRSVATPGWISADFHTHTTSSGDNVTSRAGRILSLAAEGIEFAPSTEHNRIESYRPVIESLGLGAFLATSPGVELTGEAFAIAHQNAFPIVERPRTQGGGSPAIDADPVAQIRRLAEWDGGSEKLVQQNHPDLGWILYDRNEDGVPDGGYRGMIDFMDAVEIWNPTIHLMRPTIVHEWETEETGPMRTLENNRVFNWLQILNQGIRIPGTANTDAHHNWLDSGGVRNYVRSSTDDPARIDPIEIVRHVEKGHVVMTNGPFLEVTAEAGGAHRDGPRAGPGEEIAIPHGRVRLGIRVQCADWIDVDRVHVIVNGRMIPDLSWFRYNNPYRFHDDGPVRFEESVEFDLDGDAHIIVVAAHKAALMLPLMGPRWGILPPVAITNPIFVDVDGGGFEASGDPLGHPLPVRESRVLKPGEDPPTDR